MFFALKMFQYNRCRSIFFTLFRSQMSKTNTRMNRRGGKNFSTNHQLWDHYLLIIISSPLRRATLLASRQYMFITFVFSSFIVPSFTGSDPEMLLATTSRIKCYKGNVNHVCRWHEIIPPCPGWGIISSIFSSVLMIMLLFLQSHCTLK